MKYCEQCGRLMVVLRKTIGRPRKMCSPECSHLRRKWQSAVWSRTRPLPERTDAQREWERDYQRQRRAKQRVSRLVEK